MSELPPARRPADSMTEMVQVVLPNDANPLGFILGGTVMHLIDIAGAIAGHRHTRTLLVTAAVDGLQFLHPIKCRRPDHSQGARDGGVDDVARSRGRSLFGGDADRPAADDEPRLPHLRRRRSRQPPAADPPPDPRNRRRATTRGGSGSAPQRAVQGADKRSNSAGPVRRSMDEPSRRTRCAARSYILFALAILSAAGSPIAWPVVRRLFARVLRPPCVQPRRAAAGTLRPAVPGHRVPAACPGQRGILSTLRRARVLRAIDPVGSGSRSGGRPRALLGVYGVRAAGGSDSYGYVSQARLWLAGDLHVHQDFAAAVPWPNADWTFTPLGYRPAAEPHHRSNVCAGIAAPDGDVHDAGLATVVPSSSRRCAARVLVLSTFALGVQVSGRATGALAALLTASSPTILLMTLWPMSDVPAAAFWTLSLVMAWRQPPYHSAALSGISAGVAILIRPNLAPLVVFPAGLVAWHAAAPADVRRPASRRIRARVSSRSSSLVAWVNHDLYGSFLMSGYGDASSIYGWRNLRPNLARYPRWLWETQGAVRVRLPADRRASAWSKAGEPDAALDPAGVHRARVRLLSVLRSV